MKKLIASTLIGSSLLFGGGEVKADWDVWALKDIGDPTSGTEIGIYTIDSATNTETLRRTLLRSDVGNGHYISNESGNLVINHSGKFKSYDVDTDSFTEIGSSLYTQDSNLKFSSKKYFLTGTQNGAISINGTKIIEKKSNGELHIGENSAVFKEENGREKFWAQDANGKSIPIDITNGSKLLINGRDVEQSINNVGALSAALTGLPTVPTDTTLACGLGIGTHGGDFAFSGGCASKVNDKLSINSAASVTMPGQEYAGVFEDKFSARAGFVWKLGKSTKPTQISMKEKEKMEAKIFSLEEKNEKIISQNEDLKNKNQSIISQNKSLLARLERLEKLALGETISKDLASIKLP